jgi:hypothetical protein
MRQLLNSLSDEKLQRLAKYLSYPRGFRLQNQTDYALYTQARQANRLLRTIGKNHLSLLNIDLNEVKNFYVSNLASSAAKFIKTPSIIVTYNDMLTTGGHNLSSRISRVKSTTNYKRSNYHPTNYTQPMAENNPSTPAPNRPAGTPPTTNAATPAPTTPSKSTPVKSASPMTTPTKNKSVTSSKTVTTQPSNRPRSTVISSASRKNRGF